MDATILAPSRSSARPRSAWRSLVELLRSRAETEGNRKLYTFLSDGATPERNLSYAELDQRARAIGACLQNAHAEGQRVLLLFPPGLDYIAAFFGCLYAKAIAVPAYPPRQNRNLDRLRAVYRAFAAVREERKESATDHICTGCPVVGTLDLKIVLHRGVAVRQRVGSTPELLGPAVNVAHRLLKNTVRDVIGYRPYVLLSAPAAENLGIADRGIREGAWTGRRWVSSRNVPRTVPIGLQ